MSGRRRGRPRPRGMFSSVPGLRPLGASSTPFLSASSPHTQTRRSCQTPPGGQNCPPDFEAPPSRCDVKEKNTSSLFCLKTNKETRRGIFFPFFLVSKSLPKKKKRINKASRPGRCLETDEDRAGGIVRVSRLRTTCSHLLHAKPFCESFVPHSTNARFHFYLFTYLSFGLPKRSEDSSHSGRSDAMFFFFFPRRQRQISRQGTGSHRSLRHAEPRVGRASRTRVTKHTPLTRLGSDQQRCHR